MEELKNLIDVYTLGATIVVALLGWIVALLLQGKNLKDQHKIQVKHDIYNQLILARKEAQDAINAFVVGMNPPFIFMDSKMIPFKLNLKKEYKGQFILWSEGECVLEGGKEWRSFIQKSFTNYHEIFRKYLQILYIAEDWAAALKKLLPVKDILIEEMDRLRQEAYKNLEILQAYNTRSGYDWRKWDRLEIKQMTDNAADNVRMMGLYLNDFMVLIHNELLSSYFCHRRPIRKTLDKKWKVLTKKGFIESLDRKKIKDSKNWTEKLKTRAQARLQKIFSTSESGSLEEEAVLNSIIFGTCPHCNTSILVIDLLKMKNSVHYLYSCGHKWEERDFDKNLRLKIFLKKNILGPVKSFVSKFRKLLRFE